MSREKIRAAILKLLRLAPQIDQEVVELSLGDGADLVCFSIVPGGGRLATTKDLEDFATDLAWAIWEGKS